MNTVPADIFEEEFAPPLHRPTPEEVRALAETADFHSRQPAPLRTRRGRPRTGRPQRAPAAGPHRAVRMQDHAGHRRDNLQDLRAAGLDYRRDRGAGGGRTAGKVGPMTDEPVQID